MQRSLHIVQLLVFDAEVTHENDPQSGFNRV